MAAIIQPGCPLARGAVLHCLGEVSIATNARSILQTLRDQIAAIGPSYRGLETVFDQHLIVHCFTEERVRRNIEDLLRRHWFDANSKEAFFPGTDVAPIYAGGLLKTLDLALTGPNVARIDSWWLVDFSDVKLVNLTHLESVGSLLYGQVTLLVMTPRPAITGPATQNPILGRTAEAWATEKGAGAVVTRRIKEEYGMR